MFLISKSYQQISWKTKTNNELIVWKSTACVAKARCSLFLCAIDLHCRPKTVALGDVSMDTVVHFKSFLHIPSFLHKYAPNAQLKIVPPKNAPFIPVWVTSDKNYSAQLF